MEKPSTKKPMNVLKTMVFLNNFMKKLIFTTTNGLEADKFISLKIQELKEDEYITSERRFYNNRTEWRIYISSVNRK